MPGKKLDQSIMEEITEHRYKWYTFGCKDATYLETKSKFASLGISEKLLYTFHLITCKYCRRFVAQVKRMEEWIHRSVEGSEVVLDPERKSVINQSIKDHLPKN